MVVKSPFSPGALRPLYLLLLLVWALTLVFLSLTPEVRAPAGLRLWDKFSHYAAYAVLALLLLLALSAGRSRSLRPFGAVWLISSTFGLLVEVLQWAMGAGRQWELGDLLANALGALSVCVVFRLATVRTWPPHEP